MIPLYGHGLRAAGGRRQPESAPPLGAPDPPVRAGHCRRGNGGDLVETVAGRSGRTRRSPDPPAGGRS